MKKFVCTVCGYVHEGEAAPANCPVCKVPAEKFNEQKGEMLFVIKSDYEEAMPVLMGFKLHIEQLSLQFTDYIKVTSEV